MLERVAAFSEALREAGVPVAISENVDALNALREVSLADRTLVRAALATTLVKSDSHLPTFDTLFELYFGSTEIERPGEEADASGEDQLRADVLGALTAGDGAAMPGLAQRAVARFGRVEDSPTGTLYYAYPVFRALAIDAMLRRAQEAIDADPTVSDIERTVRRDEAAASAQRLREEVARDVRRRVAAQRGPEQVARYAVPALPEDVDLLGGSAEELEQIRRAVRPLARKLAARVAMKRRRANRGALDVRRTVRHSLSTGGVPFRPSFKHRPPHRPELYLLCDVSGSMGRFARFSLMLVHALASQFSRVRSFVFVDTIDEVTHLFDHEDFVAAVDRMSSEARPVAFDEHSNYGIAFERFWERFGPEVGPKATVLILGDARNNNRATNEWVLANLEERARKVWWLNPEPRAQWDTGDSVAALYSERIDGMIEVRNLRQLEAFIERIA